MYSILAGSGGGGVAVESTVEPSIITLSPSSVHVPGIDNVTCTAYSFRTSSVKWLSGEDLSPVPFDQQNRVYQSVNVNGMEATLFVANANAFDAGEYKCYACKGDGKCDIKSIQVEGKQFKWYRP